jgi:hypothetical protein
MFIFLSEQKIKSKPQKGKTRPKIKTKKKEHVENPTKRFNNVPKTGKNRDIRDTY